MIETQDIKKTEVNKEKTGQVKHNKPAYSLQGKIKQEKVFMLCDTGSLITLVHELL